MKKYIVPLLLIVIASLLPMRLLLGYLSSYDYLRNKRSQLAKMDNGEINIAVSWNMGFFGTPFVQGINLALEQENKQGFVFTRDKARTEKKMVLHYYNDLKMDNAEMTERIATDPSIIAAISFVESTEAIASSVAYEEYGVLFLSTYGRDPRLTNHGFNYVFSTIPIVQDYAETLVDFAGRKHYKKIVCLYSREGLGGINLATHFGALLQHKGITIADSRSFDSMQADYRSLIYDLMQHSFDAILLAAQGEPAARMINQLRTMGIAAPILGATGLDDTAIWKLSDGTANNVFVASDNTLESDDREIVDKLHDDFSKEFFKRYGDFPNLAAIQGYDALRILAAAIRKSNSNEPINIAGTLKYNFKGSYKNYFFDELGRVENKKMIVKEMKNGQFHTVLGLE